MRACDYLSRPELILLIYSTQVVAYCTGSEWWNILVLAIFSYSVREISSWVILVEFSVTTKLGKPSKGLKHLKSIAKGDV